MREISLLIARSRWITGFFRHGSHPSHGRGPRFDPLCVHQNSPSFTGLFSFRPHACPAGTGRTLRKHAAMTVENPGTLFTARSMIAEQAANLRLGDNVDHEEGAKAKAAIARADKIYAVGFSFGATNVELLGLTRREHRHQIFVPNYQNEDKRLHKTLRKLNGGFRTSKRTSTKPTGALCAQKLT
jgi:hypothetical protein